MVLEIRVLTWDRQLETTYIIYTKDFVMPTYNQLCSAITIIRSKIIYEKSPII